MLYKTETYKDGQHTATVVPQVQPTYFDLSFRGNTYSELFKIASIKEAWDFTHSNSQIASRLTLYSLIGMRSDRRFTQGGSFDLEPICNFINQMNFGRVRVFDPHSDVVLALINNSERITPENYIVDSFKDSVADVIVSPDAGAYKKLYGICEKYSIPLVAASKVRDKSGEPKVTISEDLRSKRCLIADDLADGGRTFSTLAKKLKLWGASYVSLYVSHGQFNYGLDPLLKDGIDHIFTTNAYRDITHSRVTQYRIKELID